MTPMTLYPDNLETIEWGTVTINGMLFLVCPWCQAIIPSYFNNANQPGVTTPKQVHIDYHVSQAHALKNITEALLAMKADIQ